MVSLHEAATSIIEAGKFLDTKGWVPASSGNFSVRLDDGDIAMTVSGRHKGYLTPDDVMRVDSTGTPRDNKKPSAEMHLHLLIYEKDASAGAVLHTHSPNAVIASRLWPDKKFLRLEDYEMLKALEGYTTHESAIDIPVYDNMQDMLELAAKIAPAFQNKMHAFLIRGHGLYAWGATMEKARFAMEALEYMFACELKLKELRA